MGEGGSKCAFLELGLGKFNSFMFDNFFFLVFLSK